MCRQTHYPKISRKNAQWCSDFRHRNQKCEVEQIDTLQFRIVLTQGLNRQIRRMCEYLGYEVKKLKALEL